MQLSKNSSLKLDEDYRIEKDQYCWTLVYEHFGDINPATGKRTRTINRSYHGTIDQVLKKYVDNCCKVPDDITSLLGTLEKLNQSIDLLTNILKVKL